VNQTSCPNSLVTTKTTTKSYEAYDLYEKTTKIRAKIIQMGFYMVYMNSKTVSKSGGLHARVGSTPTAGKKGMCFN
jgi:hypothetical protein